MSRRVPRLAAGVLVGALVLAAVAAVSEAAPEPRVVRFYDVRITGETKQETSDTFAGSDNCRKQVVTSGRQTWSSLHRGVRFEFTSDRVAFIPGSATPGRLVRTVRYTDNGLSCGPGAPGPCQIDRQSTLRSMFEVRRPGMYMGAYLLGFAMYAAEPNEPFPPDPCGGSSPEATADGGAVDITRRIKGSTYRVQGHWLGQTFLTTTSKWRPSLTRLPFPFSVLHAGKPLTIRVSDTADESKLFDSFSGSVTIAFTPRGGR